MLRPDDFDDIHTHGRRGPRILTNLRWPEEPAESDAAGAAYSAGIHPWDTAAESFSEADAMAWLENIARRPDVLAIGECGLDALRGAPLPDQERVFLAQCRLGARLGKPVIVHCVRTWDRLLRIRRLLPQDLQMVVHGFRGRPALARQLLDAGFDLSFGQKFNPESFAATPPDRRFRETDDIK